MKREVLQVTARLRHQFAERLQGAIKPTAPWQRYQTPQGDCALWRRVVDAALSRINVWIARTTRLLIQSLFFRPGFVRLWRQLQRAFPLFHCALTALLALYGRPKIQIPLPEQGGGDTGAEGCTTLPPPVINGLANPAFKISDRSSLLL